MKKIMLFLTLIFVFVFLLNLNATDNHKHCRYINRFVGYKDFLRFILNNRSYTPSEKFSDYCSYEVYRGIWDAKNKLVKAGRLAEFCEQSNKVLTPRAWNQCFFKLGTASIFTERTNIKDSKALVGLIQRNIEMCREWESGISLSCVAGVFNGLNISYQDVNGDSLLVVEGDNPFWICDKVSSGVYHLQCLRNLVSYVYDYAEGDIGRALLLIEKNVSSIETYETNLTFFSSLAFRNEFNISGMQKVCTSFVGDLRKACIDGYANGISETFSMGNETTKVVEFCLSPTFKFEEQGSCLAYGLSVLPVNDLVNNCRLNVPEKYKVYCSNIKSETIDQ